MTTAQIRAADPDHSAWVSASAGTGKTKVLTDRVLRLLLNGVAPSRILCITYTNAAAAEMQHRIHATLSRWVMAEEAALQAELQALTQQPPDSKLSARARMLFTRVLDEPEGVRIQTIHSFCQSVLTRFPLEAGVSPHFKVIDDRTSQELLFEARQRLLTMLHVSEDLFIRESIAYVTTHLGEHSFGALVKEIIADRRKFVAVFSRPNGIIHYTHALYEMLNVTYGQSEEELFHSHFSYSEEEWKNLKLCAVALETGTDTDKEQAERIYHWISAGTPEMVRLEEYQSAFLTQKNEHRKYLVNKAVNLAYPHVLPLLKQEQGRVYGYIAARALLHTARYSEAVMDIAEALLALYDHLKRQRGAMDYDDQILHTRALLRKPGIAPWVLFKLDGGLDHLLIDEAQDTTLEQWDIVEVLVEEFFAGEGRRQTNRTLFVVGDEKQSIYSFQGAAPKAFDHKRHAFSRKAEKAEKRMEFVPLFLSFRSTPPILEVVDAVFANEQNRVGLSAGEGKIQHEAHRAGKAGRVELWPLIREEKESQENTEIWPLPDTYSEQNKPEIILCERIARTISDWISNGRILPARGRPVTAGDVLILLQCRNRLMENLVRVLKRHGIAVAGTDRLYLCNAIAVQDLLALAEFLLLPEDDLSLAAVLKSPIFGFTEEALFAVAYHRGETTLWQSLYKKQHEGKPYAEAVALLTDLLAKVDYIPPFELFSYMLDVKGIREHFYARLGYEVQDTLNEFLSQSMQFESSHPPSMQGFLQWIRHDSEIKRDMEQARDEVRIMTVHGAKGLQAPIVFLPDTTGMSRMRDKLFWRERDGDFPLMLYCPHASGTEDSYSHTLKQQAKQEAEEESRRLLYVALTRAEDELYITGYASTEKLADSCWYQMIERGMKPVAEVELRDGEEIHVVKQEQAEDAQPAQTTPVKQAKVIPMPSFAALPEETALKRLNPSHAEEMQVQKAGISSGNPHARQRGILIHRLLELLPNVPTSQRDTVIAHFHASNAAALGDINTLQTELLSVLNHSDMKELFGTQALAEVPVEGIVTSPSGEKLRFSGQIDRLLVTESRIVILEYKTGGNVPQTAHDIPPAHRYQIGHYKQAIADIYPHLPITCQLLYTASLRVFTLP